MPLNLESIFLFKDFAHNFYRAIDSYANYNPERNVISDLQIKGAFLVPKYVKVNVTITGLFELEAIWGNKQEGREN